MTAPTESSAAVGEAEITDAMLDALFEEQAKPWLFVVSDRQPAHKDMWRRGIARAMSLAAHPSVPAGAGGERDWAPTKAMLDAGMAEISVLISRTPDYAPRYLARAFRAMVAAAQRPAPAQPPEGGGGDLEEWATAVRDAEAIVRLAASSSGYSPGTNKLYEIINSLIIAGQAISRKEVMPNDQTPQSARQSDDGGSRQNVTRPREEVRASGGVPATPSAAPGGSDRERVATPEPRGWAFDYRHAHGEWVSMACKERPKEGPDRRNIRPLYEAPVLTQPASPGAVERVATDLNEFFDAKPNLGAGTAEPSIREIVFGYYANHFPQTRARELADHHLAMAAIFADITPPTGPDAAGAAGEGRRATILNALIACHPFVQMRHYGPWGAAPLVADAIEAALAALPAASGAGEDADAGVGR